MKIYLSMKTLTDFRKTVETGVDPRLSVVVFVVVNELIRLKGLS